MLSDGGGVIYRKRVRVAVCGAPLRGSGAVEAVDIRRVEPVDLGRVGRRATTTPLDTGQGL